MVGRHGAYSKYADETLMAKFKALEEWYDLDETKDEITVLAAMLAEALRRRDDEQIIAVAVKIIEAKHARRRALKTAEVRIVDVPATMNAIATILARHMDGHTLRLVAEEFERQCILGEGRTASA